MVENLINELKNISKNINRYDWKKMYEEAQNNSDYCEYSKGGESSEFGLYYPEPLSLKICDTLKVGRKIKNISNGYTFKYYFKKNKIIAVEKYLSGYLYFLTFYINLENETKIIRFNVKENKISFVAKCQYEENKKLLRYIEGTYYYLENNIHLAKEMNFTYENDNIFVEYVNIRRYLHYEYHIRQEFWKIANDQSELISKNKTIKIKV